MQNQLNKIFKLTLIILLFAVSKSHSIEGVSEFTDAIKLPDKPKRQKHT